MNWTEALTTLTNRLAAELEHTTLLLESAKTSYEGANHMSGLLNPTKESYQSVVEAHLKIREELLQPVHELVVLEAELSYVKKERLSDEDFQEANKNVGAQMNRSIDLDTKEIAKLLVETQSNLKLVTQQADILDGCRSAIRTILMLQEGGVR